MAECLCGKVAYQTRRAAMLAALRSDAHIKDERAIYLCTSSESYHIREGKK